MKKLIVTLTMLLLSTSAHSGEWWNQTHSLNEVSLLNCRLEKKSSGSSRWSRMIELTEIHSGKNDRVFSFKKMINDGYFTNRYLKVDFTLNSWNYELEDPETGEWKVYERRGLTTIKFKIDDHHTLSTENISDRSTHIRDLDNFEVVIRNPSTNRRYRIKCDSRF